MTVNSGALLDWFVGSSSTIHRESVNTAFKRLEAAGEIEIDRRLNSVKIKAAKTAERP